MILSEALFGKESCKLKGWYNLITLFRGRNGSKIAFISFKNYMKTGDAKKSILNLLLCFITTFRSRLPSTPVTLINSSGAPSLLATELRYTLTYLLFWYQNWYHQFIENFDVLLHKNSTSSSLLSWDIKKILKNCYFWVIWACLAMPTKINRINL